MTLFADTSALARLYLSDEDDAEELSRLLLEGAAPVIASELARVELARAAASAARAGRLSDRDTMLARLDADLGKTIVVVALDPPPVLDRARELVLAHRLGTLGAIHLAVALEEAKRSSDELVFVTRDEGQGAVAELLGFARA